MSLGDCRERPVGKAKAPTPPRVPGVVVRGSTLWVRRHGTLVRLTAPLTVRNGLRRWPAPVSRSPDGRYVIWFEAINSGSLSSDGLELDVTPLAGGRTHRLGGMLAYRDYLTWCGDTLVYAEGRGRVATHDKRLLVARPPDWRPRPLWRAPKRAFGSVTCSPSGTSVAVLSQQDVDDGNFFHTKWELWRVGLDGTRTLLGRPPPGFADESPRWSPDGRSLLFIRERRGNGRLWLLHGGRATGPIASLGYSLGYYGHHDWPVSWRGKRA